MPVVHVHYKFGLFVREGGVNKRLQDAGGRLAKAIAFVLGCEEDPVGMNQVEIRYFMAEPMNWNSDDLSVDVRVKATPSRQAEHAWMAREVRKMFINEFGSDITIGLELELTNSVFFGPLE